MRFRAKINIFVGLLISCPQYINEVTDSIVRAKKSVEIKKRNYSHLTLIFLTEAQNREDASRKSKKFIRRYMDPALKKNKRGGIVISIRIKEASK